MLSVWYISAISLVHFASYEAAICGCKQVRQCYQDMVTSLKNHDEADCIEDAAIGMSTVFIFLKALREFCPEIIVFNSDSLTHEGRVLYEVMTTSIKSGSKDEDQKPVILIDAGQEAGIEPVGMALYIIEQLIACSENIDMLEKVRWIILPAVNPDGMEYSRFKRETWKKNMKPTDDKLSFGVDISRNFDSHWSACKNEESSFSPDYPGPSAMSENETVFVRNIMSKYKKEMKAYLSLRRDGHAIMSPFAFSNKEVQDNEESIKAGDSIASKVNQRAGTVQTFNHDTMFNMNGKEICGNSVDMAYDCGIPMAFQMRVFPLAENRILTKFQPLPRGYESSLRAGYWNGIKELYQIVTTNKKLVNRNY